MEINSFIIRVYGLYIEDRQRVLLSDEYFAGKEMTKFPGGGLEFGEGIKSCLERELMEETGYEFHVLNHFYTTENFISSAFHTNKQLISVYYFVTPKGSPLIKTSTLKFDFPAGEEGGQSLRWAEIRNLANEKLTFPVDRHVAELLISYFDDAGD